MPGRGWMETVVQQVITISYLIPSILWLVMMVFHRQIILIRRMFGVQLIEKQM